jgi:hypothetical protein
MKATFALWCLLGLTIFGAPQTATPDDGQLHATANTVTQRGTAFTWLGC